MPTPPMIVYFPLFFEEDEGLRPISTVLHECVHAVTGLVTHLSDGSGNVRFDIYSNHRPFSEGKAYLNEYSWSGYVLQREPRA